MGKFSGSSIICPIKLSQKENLQEIARRTNNWIFDFATHLNYQPFILVENLSSSEAIYLIQYGNLVFSKIHTISIPELILKFHATSYPKKIQRQDIYNNPMIRENMKNWEKFLQWRDYSNKQ